MVDSNAGSILVERARVTRHDRYDGAQHVLAFAAPAIAARAKPGSFVHMDCGPEWLLRRPMSIMSAAGGEIEILFKQVGHGTLTLAELEPGDESELIGPIGNCFAAIGERPRKLLIGGGVGIPPMLYYAEFLVAAGEPPPLLLAGSELPFPFELEPATLPVRSAAIENAQAISRLQRQTVANRLASRADIPGSFRGFITALADGILSAMPEKERRETALYACGPTPMLEAVAALAARHGLPCQVSLEEYMACAVGGCAGCTVEVATENGPAM
ncbi:MAG: dihydroorotate dehydrogenase electron transfer subunit, partial [Gammaproteobacteria bacterium]|nr:dihydroorotate dehydrogenase electron transfer subunit [Gammaproteobacteria bacterium]